ncbi:MAG: winged helix-turn-helix transcriptional regulator [Desulfurococcales archaeon]|nr:winged helix-turn-helix transcriptional regulator [Desulfurococcales archaeon]
MATLLLGHFIIIILSLNLIVPFRRIVAWTLGGLAISRNPRTEVFIRALKNKANLEILILLSSKPSYPREISDILGLDETLVSRRLRELEKLGLVRGEWRRLRDRSVKLYSLRVREFRVRFEKGYLEIDISPEEEIKETVTVRNHIMPKPSYFVDRQGEMEAIMNSRAPVILLYGLPGVGKTAIASTYVRGHLKGRPLLWHTCSETDTQEKIIWKLSILASSLAGVDVQEVLGLDTARMGRLLSDYSPVIAVDDYHRATSEVKGVFSSLAASLSGDSRMIVISRFRERKLPHWEGRVHTIEVRPLPYEYAIELARLVAEEKNIEISGRVASMIARATRGLPGLIRGVINLRHATGCEWPDCIRRVTGAYYDSMISEVIDDEGLSLVQALFLSGGSLDRGLLCRILGLKKRACTSRIKKLLDLGIFEAVDGEVALKDTYNGLPSFPFAQPDIVVETARVLANSGDYGLRLRGLMLMAEECMISDALEIVEKRIIEGSSWIMNHAAKYLEIVERLRACGGLNPYARAVFNMEAALVKNSLKAGYTSEAIEVFEENIDKTRRNKPLYARLLSLLADMYMKQGRLAEGEAALNRAMEAARSLSKEKYPGVFLTILSTDALLAFYDRDYERGLEDSLEEADLSLVSGDLGNYAVALVHAGIFYYNLGMFDKLDGILRDIGETFEFFRGELREYLEVLSSILYAIKEVAKNNVGTAKRIVEESLGRRLSHSLREEILLVKAITEYLSGNREGARRTALELLELGEVPSLDRDLHIVRRLAGYNEQSVGRVEPSPGVKKILEILGQQA